MIDCEYINTSVVKGVSPASSHAHFTSRQNVSVNRITNPRKIETYLLTFDFVFGFVGVCLFVLVWLFSLFLFHFFHTHSRAWKKEKILHAYSSHKI